VPSRSNYHDHTSVTAATNQSYTNVNVAIVCTCRKSITTALEAVKQRVRHAESSVYAFAQTFGNNSNDINNINNTSSDSALQLNTTANTTAAADAGSSGSGWLQECTGISPASWSSAASALACCLFEQKWVDLTCAELTDQVHVHTTTEVFNNVY
jgi:lysozyme family protein